MYIHNYKEQANSLYYMGGAKSKTNKSRYIICFVPLHTTHFISLRFPLTEEETTGHSGPHIEEIKKELADTIN